MTTNTLPTHSTHAVPPLVGSMHFLDFTDGDDAIHMLTWDDLVSRPIVIDESYEVDGVALGRQTPMAYTLVPYIVPTQFPALSPVTHSHYTTQAPFILTLSEGWIGINDIQYIIRGGRVVCQ